MNYAQALEFTHSLRRLGSTPGLACLTRVLERLGNPHRKIRAIHFAGTNGKGSVCVLTAAMLQAEGYKVGLYTSPYLVDFRERFQINGQMIPKETYARLAQTVKNAMEQEGEELSQFGFITAVAFCWYAEQPCDAVVLETGLGGRLDATNVVEHPLVTAITSVSLDHTELLGDTVEAIMAEKCGIMKPNGVTVLSPGQPVEAVAVAMETAAKTGSQLVIPNSSAVRLLELAPGKTRFQYGEETYTLGLMGEYQPQNAAVALEIIRILAEKGLAVSPQAIQTGLATASHPGRCQVLRAEPLVLLDGAHNPGGAAGLAGTLSHCLKGQKAIGVCGVMHDKAAQELAEHMGLHLSQLVAVTPDNPRALPAEELANVFGRYCPTTTAAVDQDLVEWIKEQTQPVVIFGSLYLAGEILRLQ